MLKPIAWQSLLTRLPSQSLILTNSFNKKRFFPFLRHPRVKNPLQIPLRRLREGGSVKKKEAEVEREERPRVELGWEMGAPAGTKKASRVDMQILVFL